MSRKMLITSACLVVTGAAAVFAAQNAETTTSKSPPASDSKSTTDKTGHGQWHSNMRTPDHLLSTCIALGNQEEIALSEMGRQKATSEEVKKFAEMMVTDHHAFLTKLQKFAPEATRADYLNDASKTAAATDSKGKVQQTAATSDTDDKNVVETADGKTGAAGHHFNHMQMERELAAQCLAASKEKLSEKSGAEFDKCFMGIQLGMHMGMKNKLIVYQRHTSGELAKILADGQKTTEEHLEKAEAIMKDLEHQPTVTTTEKVREGARKERKVIKEKISE